MSSLKPTILAVDDMPANLLALEAVLGREYHVIGLSNGPDAIALLTQRQDIAVILMDLAMPKMDGFEAARRIKALPGCADIPIIFVSAVYTEEPHIKRGYQAGAIDYFSKPFDPDILKLKVAAYASLHQRTTILRERERQLRQSEELLATGQKLSTLLETLPVGVLIADVEGRICQTNDNVARICRATEPLAHDAYGELLGWWDAGGRTIKGAGGPIARALAGHSSHNELVDIQCFDGTRKTILGSASPLLSAETGRIAGAVFVMQDMTEPKQIERDLEARINKLITAGLDLEHAARQ